MERSEPSDGRYRVETPERLSLDYDLAGLGSRLIALMVDTSIQAGVILLVVLLSAFGLESFLEQLVHQIGTSAGTWATAIILLIVFALIWGYFLFFEWIWHGQTPGKRVAGLRVIKEGGYPIGFGDSAIRNLLRIIDLLPGIYGVGAMVMIFDSRSRRLGDLAARTLVIKERRDLKLNALQVESPSQPPAPDSSSSPYEGETLPNLHLLSPADHSLLREYFLRRPSLQARAAEEVAAHLAEAFARKLGYDLVDEGPEDFLSRLTRQMENRR